VARPRRSTRSPKQGDRHADHLAETNCSQIRKLPPPNRLAEAEKERFYSTPPSPPSRSKRRTEENLAS
jgi:hypothetical protein